MCTPPRGKPPVWPTPSATARSCRSTDRPADDAPYSSGKHHRHGVNVQFLADPAGRLARASPALPGAVHDLTAARRTGLIDALTGAGIRVFADRGYQGAGGVIRTPFKRHRHRPRLSRNQKSVNRAHARIRAIGERAAATLKAWKEGADPAALPVPCHRDRPGPRRPAAHRRGPLLRMKNAPYRGESRNRRIHDIYEDHDGNRTEFLFCSV
ncbi:hypothetical protein Pve01_63260 [Planomonospora venezuelensis]|nr:hypothetical protein Pve01_63260 [Planomonospora venezuelensis]